MTFAICGFRQFIEQILAAFENSGDEIKFCIEGMTENFAGGGNL